MSTYSQQTIKNSIANTINQQILTIVNNITTSKEYNFILTENLNNYNKKLNGNEVFIVFSFGNGEMGINETIYPVSFNIACNQNDVEEIINIFCKYTETYHLNTFFKDSMFIRQSYTTPMPTKKFNSFNENYGIVCGFRGSFTSSVLCTPISDLLISTDGTNYVSMPFTYMSWGLSMSSDAQSIAGDTNANSSIINEFGTPTITFKAFYNNAITFMNECVLMSLKAGTGTISQDKTYKVKLKITNSSTTSDLLSLNMKVVSPHIEQSKGSAPIFVCSLTVGDY